MPLGRVGGGVARGGGVGAVLAGRVAMTAMPQLVAAFHSLVGMAACLVAVAAIHTPAAYHIVGPNGGGLLEALVELSPRPAIRPGTLHRSVVLLAQMDGHHRGAPHLPARP